MTNDHVLTKILSGYLILHLHESLNNIVAMHITKSPLLWTLDIALLNFMILKLAHCTTYVTESAKTGLICTKYTYSFYHIYLFFCVGYTISVNFIEFLRKVCVYDKIFDKVVC